MSAKLCQHSPNMQASVLPDRTSLSFIEEFFVNYMLLNDHQTHKSPTETTSVGRKNHNLQVELIFLFQIMRNTNPEGVSGNTNCRYKFLRVSSPNVNPTEYDILPA